jgi:thiol-disulfide isomerase/thioredoxin
MLHLGIVPARLAGAIATTLMVLVASTGCADDAVPAAGSPGPVPDGVVFRPATVSPFPAPALRGELLSDDSEADNAELFAGRIAVMSFITSWCGTCQGTQQTLKQLRSTYGDAIALVSVAGDGEDTREDLVGFVRSSGTDWPVVFDPETLTWRNYAISEAPAIGLVDSAGSLVRVWPGGTDAATVSEVLDTLVELPE